MNTALALSGFAAILFFAMPLSADPMYFVFLTDGVHTSSSPLAEGFSFDGPSFHMLAAGSAERGRLGADGSLSVTLRSGETGAAESRSGGAAARFDLDDVIISGPDTSPVPASVNLHFGGNLSMAATFSGGTPLSEIVEARASVGGCIFRPSAGCDPRFGAIAFGGLIRARKTVEGVTVESDGTLADFVRDALTGDVEGTITTPDGMLPIGVPLSFELTLGAGNDVGVSVAPDNPDGPWDVFASSLADFSNTLSFPLSGAVFNLPPGYTVNSLSGNIVNNIWVGAPAPAAVPEPASLWLLTSGLVGLAGVAYRRHLMRCHFVDMKGNERLLRKKGGC